MKRKLWQFRLRSLFALLLLSAFAAAWWSHRSHCLERVEFHKAQAQSYAMDSQTAETKLNMSIAISQYLFNCRQIQDQEEYERKLQEYKRGPIDIELVKHAVQEAFLRRQGKSGGLDFFDEAVSERQRVAGAVSAGYLLAPINGESVPQSVDPPPPPLPLPPRPRESIAKTQTPKPPPPAPPAIATLVPTLEQVALEKRANALHKRSEFHFQQQERILRAIYRPWMNLREPDAPTVPAGPKG